MIEEILTYNTPCSGEIYKQIHEYEFKRLWKKNLRDNNKNLYWSIFSLALAIITFLCKDYGFAGFFFGFYLATFASYFSYNSKYKQYRAHYQKIIEEEVVNLKINSNDVIWEFSPDHFSFKNYKAEYKFIWKEITYCILDEKYLYITASYSLNFILDKVNIDDIHFNKTLQYLESKSQFKQI